MYRWCACFLILSSLNGCAAITGDHSSLFSFDRSGEEASYQSEKQALFDQPYVDPMTNYLIEHQGDQTRKTVIDQVRAERDQRCQTVAEQYAEEPATERVLRRYNIGYGYSCPRQVAVFEERVIQQSVASEPQATPDLRPESESEPQTAAPASSTQTVPDVSKTMSDQVLSDCYLLTAIRNFSAAREACQQPAEQGDVRSQANMATIAYAFENYASAFEWAEKAASASANAAFLLGQMYADGRGVGQNKDQAVYWYEEAVRQGHREAQQALDDHLSDGSEGNP
jgi:hypothetical protein